MLAGLQGKVGHLPWRCVDLEQRTIGEAEDLGGVGEGYSSAENTYNTPELIIENLKDAGVDMLALANDHALDAFFEGLLDTITNCEDAGMKRKEWMAKRAEAGFGTTATNRIAQAVQKKTGMETRVCIPGHMQRGGSPSAYDRVLATQFGSYAAKLVEIERYGVTVAMVNRHVTENRLADIAGKTRNVPENCDLLTVARLVATAALARRESRGGHYRRDFPQTDPRWKRRLFFVGEPDPEPRAVSRDIVAAAVRA